MSISYIIIQWNMDFNLIGVLAVLWYNAPHKPFAYDGNDNKGHKNRMN